MTPIMQGKQQMNKIEKLTPEQEAMIPVIRDKWLALGRSTEQADDADMVEAVNGLFDAIGVKRRPVMVLKSPFACMVAAHVFTRTSIGANIWANIWANIRANIRANIGSNIKFQIATAWGNHDVSWAAFVAFFDAIGVEFEPKAREKLKAYMHYIKTCGWLYVFDGMAFVSNRPSKLMLDDAGILHYEIGKAMSTVRAPTGAWVTCAGCPTPTLCGQAGCRKLVVTCGEVCIAT